LELSAKMMLSKLTANKVKCQDFLKNSVPTITDNAVNKTCGDPSKVIESSSLKTLIDYCYYNTQKKYAKIMQPL